MVAPVVTMSCPRCGASIQVGAPGTQVVCNFCATPLRVPGPPPTPAAYAPPGPVFQARPVQVQPARGSGGGVWVFVIMAVLLVLMAVGGAATWFVVRSPPPEPQPAPTGR